MLMILLLERSSLARTSPNTTAGLWKATLTGCVCFPLTLPRAVMLFELGGRATQKEDVSFLPCLEVVLFSYIFAKPLVIYGEDEETTKFDRTIFAIYFLYIWF